MRNLVNFSYHSQSGQVGVIVLLIMVVMLTVGLSVASRTTQDLFISQQEVDSARVFNAAEAGVEEALADNVDFEGARTSGNITDFNSTNIDVSYEVEKLNTLETKLFEMSSVSIDVTGNAGSDLLLQWGLSPSCSDTNGAPSLMLAIFKDVAGDIQVRYQPVGTGCSGENNFPLANIIDVDGYRREYVLDLEPDDVLVRVKPLFNDTQIRIAGNGWTLPVQAYRVRSEAENTFGNETRIVEVNKAVPAAPSVFDYATFSNDTINKQIN